MGTPYKMKGSPMQRNFGISPVRQTEGVREHLKDKTKEELEVIAKRNLANVNILKNKSSLDNIKDQMAIRDTLAGVKNRAIEIIKESPESPVKQVGLVKLAVKYGKKAYKGVKKAFKGNKAKSTEPTYFNVKTGRYQSTPSGNVHKTGDTYSETYPHFKTN